jgi:hypothetical protein
MQSPLQPKHEVQQLLIALNELAVEVVNTQVIIQSLPKDLQTVYAAEAFKVVKDFDVLTTQLKVSLENYFEYEKQNKLPAYLSYHRIYRGLKLPQ